jgi:hypothetical protein
MEDDPDKIIDSAIRSAGLPIGNWKQVINELGGKKEE